VEGIRDKTARTSGDRKGQANIYNKWVSTLCWLSSASQRRSRMYTSNSSPPRQTRSYLATASFVPFHDHYARNNQKTWLTSLVVSRVLSAAIAVTNQFTRKAYGTVRLVTQLQGSGLNNERGYEVSQEDRQGRVNQILRRNFELFATAQCLVLSKLTATTDVFTKAIPRTAL
jgi:hypothetical protein